MVSLDPGFLTPIPSRYQPAMRLLKKLQIIVAIGLELSLWFLIFEGMTICAINPGWPWKRRDVQIIYFLHFRERFSYRTESKPNHFQFAHRYLYFLRIDRLHGGGGKRLLCKRVFQSFFD